MGEVTENNGTVTRDTSFDVGSLLTQSTPETSTPTVETPETQPTAEPKKSALDLAIERKKTEITGIIVDSANEQEGPVKLRANTDTDGFREGYAMELAEQEELTRKAKLIYAVKHPANEGEYAEMITEILGVTEDENGVVHVPEGSNYIVPRTPELVAMKESSTTPDTESATNQDVESTSGNTDVDPAVLARKERKEELVKILIDKTGLGANIEFDTEEKKAIESSSVIHLIEVEDKELDTIEIERPDDGTPFMQAVDAYKLSVSKAPMTFPASGFKADMTGLSWGEFSDITMDISEDSDDYINFDKIYKKLSVIYNNMKNISIGAFKSFEEFLKHFAYVDVQLATYGLLISTQPEEDTITLVCNKEGCKKRFNFTYIPRSIINFESANSEMLEQINNINTVAPEGRLALAKASRVNKFKRVKLPTSGYLVDLGFASCYDYLYGILSLIKKYRDMDIPEEDSRWELTGMLQGVRGIYIRKSNGRYLPATTPEDIIDVLNTAVPPEDIKILNAAYEQYINQYYIEFRLQNVECPHCHTKTEKISITPDELVFLIHQRQRATQITFDNFQDF